VVTLIVSHGSVLSRKPGSEAKEAFITEVITIFHLLKQNFHQEYSFFSSARLLKFPQAWLKSSNASSAAGR
jgi:hypothetical protein